MPTQTATTPLTVVPGPDVQQAFEADWSAVGIAVKQPVVRDLWERKDLGTSRTLKVQNQSDARTCLE